MVANKKSIGKWHFFATCSALFTWWEVFGKDAYDPQIIKYLFQIFHNPHSYVKVCQLPHFSISEGTNFYIVWKLHFYASHLRYWGWWKQGRTEVWIELPYGKKSIFHKYKKFLKIFQQIKYSKQVCSLLPICFSVCFGNSFMKHSLWW